MRSTLKGAQDSSATEFGRRGALLCEWQAAYSISSRRRPAAVKHDEVIEALAPDRSDEAVDVRVLPSQLSDTSRRDRSDAGSGGRSLCRVFQLREGQCAAWCRAACCVHRRRELRSPAWVRRAGSAARLLAKAVEGLSGPFRPRERLQEWPASSGRSPRGTRTRRSCPASASG